MNRRRWGATVLAGALVSAAAAGCGVTTDPKARAIAREDVRFNLADTTTTTTTLPPSTTTVAPSSTSTTAAPSTTATIPTELVDLYFVRNGRLTKELRSLPLDTQGRIAPETTLDQLVDGPTSGGTQTLVIPQLLNGFKLSAGTARVELGPAYFGLPPEQQVLALAQVVMTLTDRPGIGKVLFRLPGDQPADIWKGDTSVTSSEVSNEDYQLLLG